MSQMSRCEEKRKRKSTLDMNEKAGRKARPGEERWKVENMMLLLDSDLLAIDLLE
jgi:hypothetical protein